METCDVGLRSFSFNSHDYYLTRGFIASTGAFNLVTPAFSLLTCWFKRVTLGFEHVTRGFQLATPGFELTTRISEHISRNLQLVFYFSTSDMFYLLLKDIKICELESFKAD